MTPLTQKKIKFNNKCGVLVNETLLERAMLYLSENILNSKRCIYLSNTGYPMISINSKKKLVHRILIDFIFGGNLESGLVVHHRDGNKLNANLCNLEITNTTEHIMGHLKGRRQENEFRIERTNASCLSRYGHPTREWIEFDKNRRLTANQTSHREKLCAKIA